jgi:hypothetical protein
VGCEVVPYQNKVDRKFGWNFLHRMMGKFGDTYHIVKEGKFGKEIANLPFLINFRNFLHVKTEN